ncbi:MAG: DEAD/DEAH box helicase family protein [Nakamurella sp.]
MPIAEDPARLEVLIDATPGAGKTTFALTVARPALDADRVDRGVIVAPTDHLRTQWADAAGKFGLHLDGRAHPGTPRHPRRWVRIPRRSLASGASRPVHEGACARPAE